ncbi:hypothetical protein [Rhizobium acidisoli]|uniref:hypothetical protein n=1 Tax=Rhizobium acidisoli TaxID=1538158 RepID=UPI0013E8E286|nr:hypothetical protein [Rhizobium acidisoli]
MRTPRSGGIETKDFGASGETEPDMMKPANGHFQAKSAAVRRPEMRQQQRYYSAARLFAQRTL